MNISLYFPNPDIESTMIAQVLDAPRKPRKSFITNKVTLVFLDFLCTSVTCTLKRISISGFGIFKQFKKTGDSMKAIIFLLSSLIVSQIVNAARTCEDYITDDWPNNRYKIESILGDSVVTDNKTGLMWKQCSEGLSGVDCMNGTATRSTWQQSLAIPNTLNVTGFAGFTNWRLPNIKELRSIVAMNCFDPSINETAFPNTPISGFWSSSPSIHLDGYAWFSEFDHGYDVATVYSGVNSVRLVRFGQ